jgi:hypothetical protein
MYTSMKNLLLLPRPQGVRRGTKLLACIQCSALSWAALGLGLAYTTQADVLLINFDSTSMGTTAPFDVTVSGLTAHFSSSDSSRNYYIQPPANVTAGYTPTGFSGNALVPATVFQSDLLISFSQPLTDISIMYAVSEFNANFSATMRLTAYSGLTLVGTTTTTAPAGNWPSGTLSLSLAPEQSLNNVVMHWDSIPPGAENFNPVFMADNLIMTTVPEPVSAVGTGAGLLLVALLCRRLQKAKTIQ